MADSDVAREAASSQQNNNVIPAPQRQPRVMLALSGSISLSMSFDWKLVRKRKAKVRLVEESNQLSADEQIDQLVSKKSRVVKAPTPSMETSTERSSSRSMEHTILQSPEDIEPFISSLEQAGNISSQYRVLEIHPDASQRENYADDRLAVALNLLHPRPDGTNPHNYQSIKLVVEGNFLFTRYSYKLVSPAVSKEASGALKMLATGKLDQNEQASVAFKVNSTEKAVAKAVLGIRGLKEVSFAGGGTVEGIFAQVLRDTVVQEPGTDIREPALETVPAHTVELFRPGIINSATYRAIPRKSPDHENPHSSERDSLGLPIDDKLDTSTAKNNKIRQKRRVMPRRFKSTTLDNEKEQELDMANMKPIIAVDMNHQKTNLSYWTQWTGPTDDELVVELGWPI